MKNPFDPPIAPALEYKSEASLSLESPDKKDLKMTHHMSIGSTDSVPKKLSVIEKHRSVIYPKYVAQISNNSASKGLGTPGGCYRDEPFEDDVNFKQMHSYKWYPNIDIVSPRNNMVPSPSPKVIQ